MAAPVATPSLNKAAYAPGEIMTLTVDHTDVDRQVMTVSVTVADAAGTLSNVATVTATIDQGTVNITNAGGKTWTLQTATLNKSVYTAIA